MIDVIILLDGSVHEVVERSDHSVAHLHLHGLVRHSIVGDAHEPDEITLLEEGPTPHSFPTYPGLLVFGKPYPPAPRVLHVTSRYDVLGTRSDHGGLDDGYVCVLGHILAEFLLTNVEG